MNPDVEKGFIKIQNLTVTLFNLIKYVPHSIKTEDKKYSEDNELSGILTIENCSIYPVMKVANSIKGAVDYIEWGVDCGCAITGEIVEEVIFASEYEVAKYIALKVVSNQFDNILEGFALSE